MDTDMDMDTDTDTDMELRITATDMDMELKINDISELEENVEYYLIFSTTSMVKHNGIYTLVDRSIDTSIDKIGNLINAGDNNIKFNLYYAINMFPCKFVIDMTDWGFYCSLFKIPTNEYVLK
jgi:hypothetical protein